MARQIKEIKSTVLDKECKNMQEHSYWISNQSHIFGVITWANLHGLTGGPIFMSILGLLLTHRLPYNQRLWWDVMASLFLPDYQFNKASPTLRYVEVVNDIDRQIGRGSRSWTRAAPEDWLCTTLLLQAWRCRKTDHKRAGRGSCIAHMNHIIWYSCT